MDGCSRSFQSHDNRRQKYSRPSWCRACNCWSVSERTSAVMHQEQSIGRAIGRDPPAVELENAGFGRVKPDLVIFQANRVGSSGDAAGWLEDQLPLPLPEEQAEGGVHASAARSSVPARPPRIQRALASGCCGASGFFHPGGGVCLCLAKGEFVSRFQRSSTDAAQHRGAVAAHQRIMNGPRARRAPRIYRWGHLRYCWRWDTGHQF